MPEIRHFSYGFESRQDHDMRVSVRLSPQSTFFEAF